NETYELELLQMYMPQGLSDAEVAAAIAEAIAATGAKAPSDMGKVMGVLKGKLAGRADMSKVSALVKAKLAGEQTRSHRRRPVCCFSGGLSRPRIVFFCPVPAGALPFPVMTVAQHTFISRA